MGPASTLWPASTLVSSYSSQCGQSAPLVLNSYMAVFFFLLCHPSDEETPWGQPAPCGQPAPWSHPYSSQCGQSAPLVLNSYMAVFCLTPRVLTGRIGMSRMRPGCWLATGCWLAPWSFLITRVTHKKEEHRHVTCLTPRVLTGRIGMSRDETRVLAGHRVLAGPMEFPHH